VAADVGPVCLLPHGYEGQGPEHSSARLERFCSCAPKTIGRLPTARRRRTTSTFCAASSTAKFRKPLILMTPKSLLRHKLASSRHWMSWARFDVPPRPVGHATDQAPEQQRGDQLKPDNQIKRVVLCTGKVYYDLSTKREKRGDRRRLHLMRVEQLYPFPASSLIAGTERLPGADIVWCQEEPRNMGAGHSSSRTCAGSSSMSAPSRFIRAMPGRPASASTATGLASKHLQEQQALCAEALTD
jgi:2-oxoglutarate dehydrogenase E1 component